MSTNPRVILLEFNELSPPLMQRFMGEGRLPNFKRLHATSQVFTTDAEEKPPFLEPWIQWVTLHTGMTYGEHQIFNLSDGHKLREKCIWDVLSAHGMKVWVCGSMNVRYDRDIHGIVMPDPWATEVEPSSPELTPYFEFVRRNVLEYTSEKVGLSARDYAAFIGFMARRGLSLETVRAIAEQLVRERTRGERWKRAVLLDRLQFDVFRWYYKKLQPEFATFFLNSTAHFQHTYWRNFEPEKFQIKPTDEEQAQFANAVRFGYEQMDALVGKFLDLAGREATLIFSTALSQQPFLKFEAEGGKASYRPRDFDAFVRLAGVTNHLEIVPVMSQNFHLRFHADTDAARAQEQLLRLKCGGETLLAVHRQGNSLHAGCIVHGNVAKDATIDGGVATARFFDALYRIEGLKSGMHHPDGMLWIRQPDARHDVHEGKVPLSAVAPMILDMYGIERTAAMSSPPVESFAALRVA